MKKLYLIIGFLPIFSFAETGENCSTINNELKRLECYDSVFKKSGDSVAKEEFGWEREISKDDFTGASIEFAQIKGEEAILRNGKTNPIFYMQSALEDGNDYIGFFIPPAIFSCHSEGCKAEYKIDDGDIKDIRCKGLENGSSGQISCNINLSEKKAFQSGSKLMVRLPLYAENNNTFTFNISNNPFIGAQKFYIDDLKKMISNNIEPKIKIIDETKQDYSFKGNKLLQYCKDDYNRSLKESNMTVSIKENTKDKISFISYLEWGGFITMCEKGNPNKITNYFIYQ